MQVEVFETYADMSRRAAELVAGRIQVKPDAVLGLPTGSTPEGFYDALVRTRANFGQVRTFNLDEYLGIPRHHAQSYFTYMNTHLFSRVNLNLAHTCLPDGMAADPDAECLRYEAAIRAAGGMDMVLLGIGHNGHIGFNEPGTSWHARTRRVELAPATRQANARFFGGLDEVPTEALTMGIGTILEARQIILLASGAGKAAIIRRSLEGTPDVSVPASSLQTHPGVTVLLDRAAAAELCGTVA